MQKPISPKRRRRGSLIAEVPVALYLLVFGFAIPAIGMAALGARVAILYVLARNAVNTACKAQTYTIGASSAAAAMTRGFTAFPYVSSTGISTSSGPNGTGSTVPGTGVGTLQVIGYPTQTTGTVQVYPVGPITSIDSTNYTYYVRWSLNGTIFPLITDTGWLGGLVPGLTGPINLNVVAEDYVENVNGLKN